MPIMGPRSCRPAVYAAELAAKVMPPSWQYLLWPVKKSEGRGCAFAGVVAEPDDGGLRPLRDDPFRLVCFSHLAFFRHAGRRGLASCVR
jgi:hypothetical protein